MDRMDKINEMMKREIGSILLAEMADPRMSFVSITHVSVTRDLSLARVSFSVLGDQNHVSEVEKGLNGASGFIRKLISQRVSIRHIPAIEFIYDDSIVYGARIEQTIDNLQNERTDQKAG